jgi:hypothetical protein
MEMLKLSGSVTCVHTTAVTNLRKPSQTCITSLVAQGLCQISNQGTISSRQIVRQDSTTNMTLSVMTAGCDPPSAWCPVSGTPVCSVLRDFRYFPPIPVTFCIRTIYLGMCYTKSCFHWGLLLIYTFSIGNNATHILSLYVLPVRLSSFPTPLRRTNTQPS